MFKRLLGRAATMLAIILTGPLISAANAADPTGGPGYFPITPPQLSAVEDKVEVIEVFSYGCIHCAQFQPQVDAWLKHIDPNTVQFTYLPATFNPYFSLMARGYFAANSLGAVSATHQKIFHALFEENKPVRSIDDLADLYESLGVNRAAFLKAAQSFFVESQLRRAGELSQAYAVDGTPTIIVAGKYRVTGESAGATSKVFTVVDQLIAKEKANLKK